MTIAGIIIFLLGFFFTLAGVIGVLRLPDIFSRLHATGKSDTLGVTLMLGGLALQQGISLDAAKIMGIVVFVAIASPTATHALARAAWKAGLKPWERETEKK